MLDAFRSAMTVERALVALGLFLVSTAISSAIVVGYLVSLAPDHFTAPAAGLGKRIVNPVPRVAHGLAPRVAYGLAARVAYGLGKNLLGLALVVIGVVLAIPGVPGQGLLTIFVGIVLLDIPGKRAFELAIVRRRAVLRNINRVRARFHRVPLVVDAIPDKKGTES